MERENLIKDESLLKKYRVWIKETSNYYKSGERRKMWMCGSSKSVLRFLEYILGLQKKRMINANSESNWLEDFFAFPRRYLNAFAQAGLSPENFLPTDTNKDQAFGRIALNF